MDFSFYRHFWKIPHICGMPWNQNLDVKLHLPGRHLATILTLRSAASRSPNGLFWPGTRAWWRSPNPGYCTGYPTYELETSFSIDEIKGIRSGTEASAKRVVKRTREPKEKFTTEFLLRDTGIPRVIERGRNLNLDSTNNIVWFVGASDTQIKQSDAIMSMYHEWAKDMYGLDQFEDVLTKVGWKASSWS